MNDSVIWKPVVGYEGIYEVSSQGNVRSVPRLDAAGHKLKGKVLKNNLDSDGYQIVGLCKNGITLTQKVHRLVATAFIGEGESMQVNHKDHNRTNNDVENLEWVTPRQNIRHAMTRDSYPVGEKRHNSTLSEKEAREILLLKESGVSSNEISRLLRLGVSAVQHVFYRRSWKWL